MNNPFQALNSYYDKIFVLSLPRLTQRIESIREQVPGLNYEIIYGIDKKLQSLELLEKDGLYDDLTYKMHYKRPSTMNLGMLCCALGHTKIYQEIINHGYKKTLILEDDILVNTEYLPQFEAIIRELPTNWDLCYLGYEKNEFFSWKEKIKQQFYQLFPVHAQLRLNSAIYKRYYAQPLSQHIKIAGFHDCTHAYAITLPAARVLLKMQQPVIYNPDNLLAIAAATGKINAYVSNHKLFQQRSAFKNNFESLTGN
jgi:glycosyl transferase family 25